MKLFEVLITEQRPYKPNKADVLKMDPRSFKRHVGKVPTNRLTKAQQKYKEAQPEVPGQPQQAQQPQQKQQAQQPQQSTTAPQITADTIMTELPKMFAQHMTKDPHFAAEILNAVGLSISPSSQSTTAGGRGPVGARQRARTGVSAEERIKQRAASINKKSREVRQQKKREAATLANLIHEAAGQTLTPQQQQVVAQLSSAGKALTPQQKSALQAQIVQAVTNLPDTTRIVLHKFLQDAQHGGDGKWRKNPPLPITPSKFDQWLAGAVHGRPKGP